MWKGIIVRRRRLGMASVRELCRLSKCGVVSWIVDQPAPDDAFDIFIRWGCTSDIVACCVTEIPEVLNTAAAIHQVNDKTGFRRFMQAAMPGQDRLCPTTYFAETPIEVIGIPNVDEIDLIVRPQHHSRGRDLFRCRTWHELEAAVRICGPNWYASELFPKTHEYRVCIIQGRVAWVASKTPGNPEDIAWNVAQGGRFDNVRWGDWPLKVVRVACAAFNITSLDFGGVDVMWNDTTQEAKVLEINSAPSLTSPYRQEALARCFDYIMEHENKSRIPITTDRGGWRKFIHPALTEEAVLV